MAPEINPAALRAHRERLGLTQRELAKQVGVSTGDRVSLWERGSEAPHASQVRRLSEALNVPINELLADHDSSARDLRRLREEAGLDLTEVAHATGIPAPTLRRWEGGRVSRYVSPEIVRQLSAAFRVSVEEVGEALRNTH